MSGLRGLVRDAFGQVDVIHELPHPEYPPDGFVELVELTARYRFLVNLDRFGRAHGPDSFTTTHKFIAPHRDAGPCAGCGGTVRRYGELANPLCSTCRKES